jgi:fructose-bisphosphate aldolase class II
VVALARNRGVSVEGEIGSVSYNEQGSTIRHQLTDPQEAARFAEESEVDALAVSVGTVHKLLDTTALVSRDLLARIAAAVATPLVIHGTSGVPEEDLRFMAGGLVAKFNIGTLLRRAWGETLRSEFARTAGAFDRLTLTAPGLDALEQTASRMIAILAHPESHDTDYVKDNTKDDAKEQ